MNIHRNTININGLNIFYRDTKTKGPTILCLHGRWGRGENWTDLMFCYGNKYRIIAPDQRGHGLSDKPISKYTADEMADDMMELIKLLNCEPVTLVGHSMGGRIAGYLSALYPEMVKNLAILDKCAAGPEKPSIKYNLTKNWPLSFSNYQEAKNFISEKVCSKLWLDYFMESLFETKDGYELLFSRQAIAANIEYEVSWYHLLPNIQCPVTLITAKNGEAVPKTELEKMESLIPKCKVYEIPNPDHFVHKSVPDEFYSYFDKFLNAL